ncbi:hypothetical protein V6N11_003273 [Hibiscus sabdariffa]|uniref:Uncharacterized protein n=1 Tax=Hibiscus sabdariffa TaxID=183260 RepID=A0ABR2SCU0_9ROSI
MGLSGLLKLWDVIGREAFRLRGKHPHERSGPKIKPYLASPDSLPRVISFEYRPHTISCLPIFLHSPGHSFTHRPRVLTSPGYITIIIIIPALEAQAGYIASERFIPLDWAFRQPWTGETAFPPQLVVSISMPPFTTFRWTD